MFELVDYIVSLFHDSVMAGCMDRTNHSSGLAVCMVYMFVVLVYMGHMIAVLVYMGHMIALLVYMEAV